MHFIILLSDLLTLPSVKRMNERSKMRSFFQTIIRELVKVLGVKCPNCKVCFLNLNLNLRSDIRSIIHLNDNIPSDKLHGRLER